jgi:hypothetical protein
MDATKMKVLWMITERADKSYWTRVGVGLVNRDGSINLVLEAVPLAGGRLQLRDYTPRDAEHASTEQEATQPAAASAVRSRAEARAEPRP